MLCTCSSPAKRSYTTDWPSALITVAAAVLLRRSPPMLVGALDRRSRTKTSYRRLVSFKVSELSVLVNVIRFPSALTAPRKSVPKPSPVRSGRAASRHEIRPRPLTYISGARLKSFGPRSSAAVSKAMTAPESLMLNGDKILALIGRPSELLLIRLVCSVLKS